MHTRDQNALEAKSSGRPFNTIFYQGNASSQTQVLKYIGNDKVVATTGQTMWCTGRNNLKPINIATNVIFTPEIADVNLKPFDSYLSYLNPINWVASGTTYLCNRRNGFQFETLSAVPESVVYHVPLFKNISIGQRTDIESHKKRYQHWLASKDRHDIAVFLGVSRGTAATFCALAEENYEKAQLVILEGAIDSVENVIENRAKKLLHPYLAPKAKNTITSAFRFFKDHNIMQYDPDGPSPLKYVDRFPENIPVVFITSKADAIVPRENTERIARALADRGKNEVYLLILERSSHPNYMFDDEIDRKTYQNFIHAIYEKYDLQHNPKYAARGRHLLDQCLLKPIQNANTYRPSC